MTDDIQEVTVHISVIDNGTVHMYWNTKLYVHDSEDVSSRALDFIMEKGHDINSMRRPNYGWSVVDSLIERHNEHMN
tara:strand:+ start:2909 stop:3139 length:231 start_codon:yes stop_codon:yes gene_type:complete